MQDLAKRNGLQAAADVSYVYKDPTQGTVYQTNLRGIDPKTPDYATKLFEMFDYNLGEWHLRDQSLHAAREHCENSDGRVKVDIVKITNCHVGTGWISEVCGIVTIQHVTSNLLTCRSPTIVSLGASQRSSRALTQHPRDPHLPFTGAVDAQLESLAKAAAVKYVRGPRKKVERIFEKARLAYQGHLNRVTDYERRSFVCADFAEMARVIEMFPADLEVSLRLPAPSLRCEWSEPVMT